MSTIGNFSTHGSISGTGLSAFVTAIDNGIKAGAVPYGTVAYSADATPILGVKVGVPVLREYKLIGGDAVIGPLSGPGNIPDQLAAKRLLRKFVILADGMQGANHVAVLGYLG